MRATLAILASCCRLHLAIKGLVDDAIAAMLTANFWPLTITITLMKLLCKELEKFVRVLLLGRDEVLKCLFLRNPKPGKNICRRVAICIFQSVEVLEHVVHSTAQAVGDIAIIALMPVAKVKIAQQWVM